VGQIVPLSGRQDTGLPAGPALAAARETRHFIHGVGTFGPAQIKAISRAGNQAQQACKRQEYRLFHHYQSVNFRKENPVMARTLHQMG
jgi:hypothetical protein